MSPREFQSETWQRLIAAAVAARRQAYAPYSQFAVGAALLTADGTIFSGCNVENGSYGMTLCAERVAVGTAIAAGQQKFMALVIAAEQGAAPCGGCRQVLAEFCQDLPVFAVDAQGGVRAEWRLAELLPSRFELLA